MAVCSSRQGVRKFATSIDGNDIHYSFRKLLGRGSFATAELYDSSRQVVLKTVFLDHDELLANPKALKMTADEANVLSTLCHPNIVRIFNAWQDEDNCELILELEYCGGKSLKQIITRMKMDGENQLEWVRLKDWLSQIAVGISYIHDMGIVHRDLKTDNVLLSTDLKTIKIADFGTAKLRNTAGSTFQGTLGTFTYMAPETLGFGEELEQGKSHPKVDVWAFGVVAFELAMFELPFTFASSSSPVMADIFKHYNTKGARPDRIDKLHPLELRTLLETKLLVLSQQKRASMDEVLEDPFFGDQIQVLRKAAKNYIHDQIKGLQLEIVEMKKQHEKAEAEWKADRDSLEAKVSELMRNECKNNRNVEASFVASNVSFSTISSSSVSAASSRSSSLNLGELVEVDEISSLMQTNVVLPASKTSPELGLSLDSSMDDSGTLRVQQNLEIGEVANEGSSGAVLNRLAKQDSQDPMWSIGRQLARERICISSINTSFKQCGLNIEVRDLRADLEDGTILIRWLSALSGKIITVNPSTLRIRKIDNVNFALGLAKKLIGGSPIDISAEDIVNGDLTRIVLFIETIIQGTSHDF